MTRVFLLFAVLCVATAANAKALRCDITQKTVCQASGCKPIPADVWSIIQIDKQAYARCDATGCNTHMAKFFEEGAFLYIQVGPSTIAKMATIDVPLMELKKFSFHEIATQFHAVYVSFGACKPS